MHSPKFSIIVPIYNVENYIDTCVKSILAQSYKNVEIILVDDGSVDSGGALCDKYAILDSRIKVIHKKNGGLVSARREGTMFATGDYIMPVDGDDWIAENYVESFAKVAEEYDADIICCGYYKATEKNNMPMVLRDRKGFYSKEDIEREIFPKLIQAPNATYFAPSLWAKAFKKDLYIPQQLAVDTKIKIGEDGACVIPCIYNAKKMYILPKCLYYYRQNMAGMTKAKKAFPWNGPERIHRHLEKQIDMSQFDFQEQLYRKTCHELFSVVVSRFYQNITKREIILDIDENLKKPIYAEAIKKCKFKELLKAKLMCWALKYRQYTIIRLYAKFVRG